jgi:anion-transporting  ArsA/GET3 family ATPase
VKLKLKLRALYTAFLGNKITNYLEKAAPGVREMVLLGKIWFERNHYDHVVVDMPSSGYALTMIHTPFNFAALFPGGPIYHDAKEMIATFSNPKETALVAVSIAEEMPVQEALEMAANLRKLMPKNPAWLVLNRLVQTPNKARKLYEEKWEHLSDSEKKSPLWQSLDYLIARENRQESLLEDLEKTWATYALPRTEVLESPGSLK